MNDLTGSTLGPTFGGDLVSFCGSGKTFRLETHTKHYLIKPDASAQSWLE